MSNDSQELLNQVEHKAAVGTPANDTEEHLTVSSGQHELHASGLSDSVLTGDSADDHLVGAQHNDVLDGGNGNDTLDGGDGNDVLIAGGQTDHGANSLDGGTGDDILVAGGVKTTELHNFLQSHQEVADAIRADTKLSGLLSLVDAAPSGTDATATAANTFAFHSGNGHDSVYNFHALGDKIQIDRGVNGSGITDIASLVEHVTVSGNDVTIDLGQGNSITLVGVDVAHLSADNIVWA